MFFVTSVNMDGQRVILNFAPESSRSKKVELKSMKNSKWGVLCPYSKHHTYKKMSCAKSNFLVNVFCVFKHYRRLKIVLVVFYVMFYQNLRSWVTTNILRWNYDIGNIMTEFPLTSMANDIFWTILNSAIISI